MDSLYEENMNKGERLDTERVMIIVVVIDTVCDIIWIGACNETCYSQGMSPLLHNALLWII